MTAMHVDLLEFVEIHWDDTVNNSDWLAADDLPKVRTMISCGWVVFEDKRELTLASTLDPSGDNVDGAHAMTGVISIPKGCIVARKRLA